MTKHVHTWTLIYWGNDYGIYTCACAQSFMRPHNPGDNVPLRIKE